MENMNYFFYVSYFDQLSRIRSLQAVTGLDFSRENSKLFNYRYPVSPASDDIGTDSFSLFTTYPGMLIGTGYPHDFKGEKTNQNSGGKEKGEQPVKIGFTFDYVTGLPTIPGSSVKGLLRSYFPDPTKEKQKYKDALGKLICALTGKEDLDTDALLKDIFDNGDVFLDAVPVIEEGQESILAEDYITPHKDPLKGPSAIRIMKVKPNVKYRFRFILHDQKPSGGDTAILTKAEKLELFRQLILLGGAGAKTNVGFGQFSEKAAAKVAAGVTTSNQTAPCPAQTNGAQTRAESDSPCGNASPRSAQANNGGRIQVGQQYQAECRGLARNGRFMNFRLPTGNQASCRVNGKDYSVGKKYTVKITREQDPYTAPNGRIYINYDCEVIG